MLEKIKKLLDSGCWVEVEVGKNTETGLKELVKILGYNDIYEKIIFFTDGAEIIYIKGKGMEIFSHFDEIIEILSIKPIARPLYQYKVGDKVVVLENYEEDIFFPKLYPGDTGNILGYWNGSILVEKDGDTYSIDIRCIAPVLD